MYLSNLEFRHSALEYMTFVNFRRILLNEISNLANMANACLIARVHCSSVFNSLYVYQWQDREKPKHVPCPQGMSYSTIVFWGIIQR